VGINRKGHVALRSVRSMKNGHLATRAALWNGHRLVDLGTIDKSTYCVPVALNDADEVLGTYEDNIAGTVPFLYTGGQMLPLTSLIDNAEGWTLSFPNAIANDGTIVGVGYFQGEQHSFVLNRAPAAP
jgi:hypothetical protein